MALRLKNNSYTKISGKFSLKNYGNFSFDKEVEEYVLQPGETKDIAFYVKSPTTASDGINIITADIIFDNELYAEFPQGYIELVK